MRTRNSDSSSKSTIPKTTPSAIKPAGVFPAANRKFPSKVRNAKNLETSPVTDPDQSQKQNSLASTTTMKSVKRKTPTKPRTKVVADTPNVEEQLGAEVNETTVVENYEAAERVEEAGSVTDIDVDNIESEKKEEQSFGSIGLTDEREQKPMEVDEPVIEKECELVEKGKSMEDVEPIVSQDASLSFKQPGCTIVDLNISVDDSEVYTGAKEGGEELKEEELKVNDGEKGKDELKEQEGEKGKEEFNQQKREKEMEEFKIQEGEKGTEELKEQGGDKEMEEYKIQEVEKELKEQEGKKGKEELKEHKGEKGKEVIKEPVGEKEKEDLKERGEKRNEELVEEIEKAKGEETNNIGHEEHSSVEVQVKLQKDVDPKNYGVEGPKSDESIDLGEQGRVELEEEDVEEDPEEDPEEPPKETETLDEEHMEFEAIAKERKIRKEHEIFVGGLDREATEEDLRKVFQRIGEVVEVRLHKNSSTNKNKVYAFVKFSRKEHAKKALSEMKNPVIHGKRCGTAPCEDNDTLFLGNICNTWTKEAIIQKLKDYGVEGVESITVEPDVQHEGLSQGFAFLEFSCHADAMLAYKRLQKPDVIFGHAERTAKVAFAEPIHEPDSEIMAQVKSVFIDGLPLDWDEDHVRELLKSYGEIVRIVLSRNMSTAKSKDYGFVDFSTHEAALACVDSVNKSELGDGKSEIKVRARLSKPLPKMQAVKGGMCGDLRIGQARSEAYPRSDRGFGRGRGRQPFNNRGNFNRGRGLYHHGGRSQIGRMGFRDDPEFSMHPDFHQWQFGPQGAMRGGYHAGSRGGAPFTGPSRHYHDRAWYGIPDGGPGEPLPPRRPYSSGGQFDMPFMGRHVDDPYLYDDDMRGIKRPLYMSDPEPDFMGPNRFRPRFDYADPSMFHGTRYHDYAGAGSRPYPQDYHGSDHGGGPYSSFYGGDGPHGHRHYY
ncbi:RNA-binding motif protein, Y chromosome, family 1 member B [Trifolium repens]|nr:RNA-binding motif protein, Y chromosome, family 1 member B [Trifolium repens]